MRRSSDEFHRAEKPINPLQVPLLIYIFIAIDGICLTSMTFFTEDTPTYETLLFPLAVRLTT